MLLRHPANRPVADPAQVKKPFQGASRTSTTGALRRGGRPRAGAREVRRVLRDPPLPGAPRVHERVAARRVRRACADHRGSGRGSSPERCAEAFRSLTYPPGAIRVEPMRRAVLLSVALLSLLAPGCAAVPHAGAADPEPARPGAAWAVRCTWVERAGPRVPRAGPRPARPRPRVGAGPERTARRDPQRARGHGSCASTSTRGRRSAATTARHRAVVRCAALAVRGHRGERARRPRRGGRPDRGRAQRGTWTSRWRSPTACPAHRDDGEARRRVRRQPVRSRQPEAPPARVPRTRRTTLGRFSDGPNWAQYLAERTGPRSTTTRSAARCRSSIPTFRRAASSRPCSRARGSSPAASSTSRTT